MVQALFLPRTEVPAFHPTRSQPPVPPLPTLEFSACQEACFPIFSVQLGLNHGDSKKGEQSDGGTRTVLESCD